VSGEIHAAAARLRERVDASGAVQAAAAGVDEDGAEAVLRLMFSGLDLDFDELQEVMSQRRAQFQLAALLTGQPGLIAATFLSEGIATGLLIAQARAREEAGP
jgi:hypothetical protein